MNLESQISAAATVIQQRWAMKPRVGIVLGTGLGHLADDFDIAVTIPYQDIPGFGRTTAMGHAGRLMCGTRSGLPILAMQGRLHRYEGYPMQQVTFPIRVMKHLGIEIVILSNASGGVHPRLATGDVMVIDDHLNLMWGNPLIGPNDDELGPRFPDLVAPYDPALIHMVLRVARCEQIAIQRGVYAAVSGPNYETRAEYRMLRRIGADVVGMSTVPEVLVAIHAGMRVLALSAVTNVCRPDCLEETSGQAVVEAATRAEPKMRRIVLGVLAQIAAS